MSALPAKGSRREAVGRVQDRMVEALGAAILAGDPAPGERLPNEAELALRFAVSRTSVREAIRFLAAKGLVEARPRTGTVVREREAWNLLDADLLRWGRHGPPDPLLVASLLEARRLIEPEAAALAAARATAEDLVRIERAWREMARLLPIDLDGCCAADVAFHAAVLRASHNVVFGALVGTLAAALEHTFRLSTSVSTQQACTLQAHADVLDAIRLRDADRARATMAALLDVASEDLAPALESRR